MALGRVTVVLSLVMSGHQWSLVAISGSQWLSVAWHSVAISGKQHTCSFRKWRACASSATLAPSKCSPAELEGGSSAVLWGSVLSENEAAP